MPSAIDLTGQRFGRLTAVRPAALRQSRHVVWECLCSCGQISKVRTGDLRCGKSKSCGCLRRERWRTQGKITTHGHSKNGSHSPTYKSWQAMKQRCLNPRATRYEHYGGRGITICPKWLAFEGFLEDLGERPSLAHCLSRANNDGDYEPGNAGWDLESENSREMLLRRYAA